MHPEHNHFRSHWHTMPSRNRAPQSAPQLCHSSILEELVDYPCHHTPFIDCSVFAMLSDVLDEEVASLDYKTVDDDSISQKLRSYMEHPVMLRANEAVAVSKLMKGHVLLERQLQICGALLWANCA